MYASADPALSNDPPHRTLRRSAAGSVWNGWKVSKKTILVGLLGTSLAWEDLECTNQQQFHWWFDTAKFMGLLGQEKEDGEVGWIAVAYRRVSAKSSTTNSVTCCSAKRMAPSYTTALDPARAHEPDHHDQAHFRAYGRSSSLCRR